MTTNTPELRAAFESLTQITRQLSDTLENVIYHLEQNDTMASSPENMEVLVRPFIQEFYDKLKIAHFSPLDTKIQQLEEKIAYLEEIGNTTNGIRMELASIKAEIANLKSPSVSAAAQPFTTFTPPSVRPASSSVPPQDQPPAMAEARPIISPIKDTPFLNPNPVSSPAPATTLDERMEAFTTEFNDNEASDYQFFSAHHDLVSLWAKELFDENSNNIVLEKAEEGNEFQGKKITMLPVGQNKWVPCYAISISKLFLQANELSIGLLKQSGFMLAFDIVNPEKMNNSERFGGKLLSPALFLEESSETSTIYKLYKKGRIELI